MFPLLQRWQRTRSVSGFLKAEGGEKGDVVGVIIDGAAGFKVHHGFLV